MNSRFVKNNIGLLAVTGACALGALVGLVLVVIHAIRMNTNINNVKDVSEKIRNINNQRPSPVEGNVGPIEADINTYQKAVDGLLMYFGNPLEPAKERFFEVLTIRKTKWLESVGIDPNSDEVVKRLMDMNADFDSLRNADFDQLLVLYSCEVLAKKAREALTDEGKAKQIRALIPNVDQLDDAELTKQIAGSGELEKELEVSFSAEDLAKKIKLLPANGAAAKKIVTLIPEAGKLDAAGWKNMFAAAAELDKQLAAGSSAADLAKKVKETPTDAAVKNLTVLIPDAEKLDEAEVAKRIEAVRGLEKKLRDAVVVAEVAKKLKAIPAKDANAENIRALIPDLDKLDEDKLADRIAAVAPLEKKLRELFPDSDPETLKKLREIPDKISAEKFMETFNRLMEGKDENDFTGRMSRFVDFRRDNFENWEEARQAFIAAAENRQPGETGKVTANPCIIEKLEGDRADAVLLSTLGLPTRFKDYNDLQDTMNNILNQLKEHKVDLGVAAERLGILAVATGPESGGQGDDVQNLKADEYPDIANHLDIVSYMLFRVGGAKVGIYHVQIRLKTSGGEGGVEGGRSFKDSKESRDGFDVYHYTLEISGTMEQIRDAVRRLDDCFDVRRVYQVKNIDLYAENSIAYKMFPKRDTGTRSSSAPQVASESQRSRRDGEGAVTVKQETESNAADEEQKKRQKRMEEYEKKQNALPPEKRDGYGEPLTAEKADNDTFRAVIDVEYVVKPRK